MKTKFFLLGACFLLLISCVKESESDVQMKTDDYAFENAGQLHNESLNYYYLTKSNTKSVSRHEDRLEEIINVNADFLIQKGFNKAKVQKIRDNVIVSTREYKLSKKSETIVPMPDEFINLIENQNNYSPEFISEIHKILDLGFGEEDLSRIINYINNDFQETQFILDSDNFAKEIFVDIFNNSLLYWTGNDPNYNPHNKKLKKSSWVIINDGIGGILGSAFGPMGSIILGTAFSVGTNEE